MYFIKKTRARYSMFSDTYIIKKALEIAQQSKYFMKHASIVVKRYQNKWRIVAIGFNEIVFRNAALRKVPKRKDKYVMFNVSISERGQVRNSKPCSKCAETLRKAGINCYHTTL